MVSIQLLTIRGRRVFDAKTLTDETTAWHFGKICQALVQYFFALYEVNSAVALVNLEFIMRWMI